MSRVARSFQVGRRSLVAVALVSFVAQSTLGDAVVVHQHGTFGIHMHVLGFGQLQAGVQDSAEFGHPTTNNPGLFSVHPIAVVGAGSVPVPSVPPVNFRAHLRENPQLYPPVIVNDPPYALSPPQLFDGLPKFTGNKATTALLLHNHALLL